MPDVALDFIASLVMPSGERWGSVAVPEQWARMRRWLGPTLYHFDTASRGWAKTEGLAAALMAMMATALADGSRCFWLAADRDQGRLAVETISGFVRRTPGLLGPFVVDAYRVTFAPSGSTLEVLAADVASSWGITPAIVAVDEIAWWPDTDTARALFDSVSTAAAKVSNARMFAITAPSDPAHWSHRLLEHARVDDVWSAHEQRGPAPWIELRKLAEQKRRLAPWMYARLFEGEWATGDDRLADLDDVRACVTLSGPVAPAPNRRYTLGLDLGLKRDRSVAAICHLDGSTVVLDRMAVWAGTRQKPVRIGDIEDWIVEAHRTYRGCKVIFDPWQATGLAQRLAERHIRTEEFTFSATSVGRVAQSLYNAIRDHDLALPDDVDLIDELANVRLRETSPGVLRMDHDAGRHDDRAVALGLAAHSLLKSPRRSASTISAALLVGANAPLRQTPPFSDGYSSA